MSFNDERAVAAQVKKGVEQARDARNIANALDYHGAPFEVRESGALLADALERAQRHAALVYAWYERTTGTAYQAAGGLEAVGEHGMSQEVIHAVAGHNAPGVSEYRKLLIVCAQALDVVLGPDDYDIPSELETAKEAQREAREAIAGWLQANPEEA